MGDLPLAVALVAGAVAALNPCGFALLPVYLTALVAPDAASGEAGGDMGARRVAAAVLRAVRFAVGMTVGFVAVFGLFGLVVAPVAVSVQRYLPIVTVVVGLVLVGVGVAALAGRSLGLRGLPRAGTAPTASWPTQVGYGVTFALVSLSCTIAPFLAVTSGALRRGSVPGVVVTFVVYAIGMGIVVLVAALAVATTRASVARRLRGAGRAAGRVAGALLVVAGLYVLWYGVWELRVLGGASAGNPVVDGVARVQGAVVRWVADLGAPVVVAVGAVLAVGVAVVLAARRRGRRDAPQDSAAPDGRSATPVA